MKVVFWNIKKLRPTSHILAIIDALSPDLFCFCEAEDDFLREILSVRGAYQKVEIPGCERVFILTRLRIDYITQLRQGSNYATLMYNDGTSRCLICVVHLGSQQRHSVDEGRRSAERIHQVLVEEEQRHDICETMIIGDFNYSPFETPLLSFSGLCATNSVDCVERSFITRDGERKDLFYNPMWTLYDKYKRRPGTFRYRRPGIDVIMWHFIDQILIRPCLIDRFDFDELQIVSEINDYKFANANGTPIISDHLPLVCQVEL